VTKQDLSDLDRPWELIERVQEALSVATSQKPDNWSGEDDADDSIVTAYTKSVAEGLAGTHIRSVQAAMIVLRQRLLRVSYTAEQPRFHRFKCLVRAPCSYQRR
jgi:hypothetical protein